MWKAIERNDQALVSLLPASSADAHIIVELKVVFDVAWWSFLNGNRQRYLRVLDMILSGILVANGMSNETLYRMMERELMCWAIDLDVINVARLFVDSGTDPDQDAFFWVVEVTFLSERGSDPKT